MKSPHTARLSTVKTKNKIKKIIKRHLKKKDPKINNNTPKNNNGQGRKLYDLTGQIKLLHGHLRTQAFSIG